MSTTVGFVGAGAMGLPMAKNLLSAGYGVRVYNRTAARVQPLVEAGAVLCETPAEAATGVSVVFSMLSDDAALEAVTIGDEGILNALEAGGVHVSHSTVSPALARRLAELHDLHDSIYLGSPVFGRPDVAQAGKLNILLSGGDAVIREKVTPFLQAMGQRVWDFGDDPSAANVAKLCGNFMIGAAIETMAEAFTLAEKNGVERQAVYELLTQTLFASPVFQGYGRLIAAHQYLPAGFTVPLGQKDITLAQELGRASGVPLPFAGIVQDKLIAARAKGREEMDWACLGLEAAENAGLRQ